MSEARLRFENLARRTGFSEQALQLDHSGLQYVHPHAHYAWEGWKAAWDFRADQVNKAATSGEGGR